MNNTNPNKAIDVKHHLRQQGMTIKSWAEQNGYTARQVTDVVRGGHKCKYGIGREIAEKLGLIVPTTESSN